MLTRRLYTYTSYLPEESADAFVLGCYYTAISLINQPVKRDRVL